MTKLTRRSFLARAATLGSASIVVEPVARVPRWRPLPAEYPFTQFHNQTTTSSLHQRLVQMWSAIRRETGGRVDTQVFAENNNIPGSDPAVLQMLVEGEIQFFTLMGGILGSVVPAAEVQQVPFAFRSAADAYKAMDGALGAYLRQETAAKGIFLFPVAAFDNGMRQITCRTRPVVGPADLVGMKIRVPAGQIFSDTFAALGAEPVTVNVNGLYDALKTGRVDAQENPLAVTGLFKLYEVVKYVSMTNHMWSGFNLMANRTTWMRLPADIRAVIERNATKYVHLQRRDQDKLNTGLRVELATRGLVFNTVDPAPFRAKLSDVYETWKDKLGSTCWSLLYQSSFSKRI